LKLTIARILGNEIVKLYVGKKRKEFTIHKKLLCDRADFFSKAFNGGFQEAKKGEMYLPEDEPDHFACLVDFLYRGTAPEAARGSHGASHLRRFYAFAEKLCLLELMDKTIDSIKANHCELKTAFLGGNIEFIYTRTHEKSRLRLLCVAEAAFRMKQHAGDEERGATYVAIFDTAPEFFRDMFCFQTKYGKELQNSTGSWMAGLSKLDPCIFHCHGEDAPCYLKESL
jgi:hypothetical protein